MRRWTGCLSPQGHHRKRPWLHGIWPTARWCSMTCPRRRLRAAAARWGRSGIPATGSTAGCRSADSGGRRNTSPSPLEDSLVPCRAWRDQIDSGHSFKPSCPRVKRRCAHTPCGTGLQPALDPRDPAALGRGGPARTMALPRLRAPPPHVPSCIPARRGGPTRRTDGSSPRSAPGGRAFTGPVVFLVLDLVQLDFSVQRTIACPSGTPGAQARRGLVAARAPRACPIAEEEFYDVGDDRQPVASRTSPGPGPRSTTRRTVSGRVSVFAASSVPTYSGFFIRRGRPHRVPVERSTRFPWHPRFAPRSSVTLPYLGTAGRWPPPLAR